MGKILINDCTPEIEQDLKKMLGGGHEIVSQAFKKLPDATEYQLILIQSDDDSREALRKIKALRSAVKFRNIPIVLIAPKDSSLPVPVRKYILAGATEVLSLSESPVACGQILQSYLIPGRRPLDREMQYLEPFIDGTRNVLGTMASMDAKFKDVYFRKDLRIFGDVSGVIGLSGKAEGTIVVTFYWDLAQLVISRMMEVEPDAINAEIIHDGVGELINMISGFAKKSLAKTPYHFQLSLPTVVVGWGHEIGHPDNASIAVLVFDVDEKAFAVQVSLTPKAD